MRNKVDSHIIVIFGASGDLSQKKLIPAIYSLFYQKLLTQRFVILGVGRTAFSREDYQQRMAEVLLKEHPGHQESISIFCQKLHYQSIATDKADDYFLIKKTIDQLCLKEHLPHNILFYLSTPPSLYYTIPKYLALNGLNDESDGFKRLVIEKPFGYDLASAKELNQHLLYYYDESQLYRIDHYLGKETVQNLMVFRFANLIFEPLWNANNIESIQISAAEQIGIGNRGGYYEKSGVFKDMIQNHLLQLMSIVAMEPPAKMDDYSVRNEMLKVLQSIYRYHDYDEIKRNVVVGQYTAGTIEGESCKAYRDENNVRPDSMTQTYAAMRLYIDNWRWNGIPFYLRAGKRMQKRVTEVVINFKHTPHPFFSHIQKADAYKNQLIIRIQPDEGIKLTFAAKKPGGGFHTREVDMNFFYSEFDQKQIPLAYERLILDALCGDSTLFSRNDTVETCWRIMDPIIDAVDNHPESFLQFYESGTWGPDQADALLAQVGHKWRNPCNKLKIKHC